MNVLDGLGDEGSRRVARLVGLECIRLAVDRVECLPIVTYLYMGLRRGSKIFFPARCLGNGNGGRTLLTGRVLVLFSLEHFGIIIAMCRFLISCIVHRGIVGCVKPGSGTVGKERAFENCAGRKGKHSECDKGER